MKQQETPVSRLFLEFQVVQEDPCWDLTWMSLVKVSIQASTVFLIRTWSVQSLQRTQKHFHTFFFCGVSV